MFIAAFLSLDILSPQCGHSCILTDRSFGTRVPQTRGTERVVSGDGVGFNTPIIVKYPFWFRTWRDPNARYTCLNYGETYCSKEIADRLICIDGDIGAVLLDLQSSG